MRETRFFVMWLKNAQKPTFITEKKFITAWINMDFNTSYVGLIIVAENIN